MSTITLSDGTTITTTDTPNGRTVTVTPGPNTPAANADTLTQRALAALAANSSFLALPDPTAANQAFVNSTPTTAQAIAQVKALSQQMNALIAQAQLLTRENNAIIRLLIGALDATDGT